MSKTKRNSLLLLSIAGMLILVLAISLPNLVLSSGRPFAPEKSYSEDFPTDHSGVGSNLLTWTLRGIVAFVVVFSLIYLVILLRTPEGRRHFLAYLVLTGLVLLLAYFLSELQIKEASEQPEESEIFVEEEIETSGLEESIPSEPPAWLTSAVILAVSLAVVVVAFGVIWYFQQRAKVPESSLEKLAQEAQNALDSLLSGGDLQATVIQCYQEMNRVVKEERGIARETAMTAREFEERLVSKGLPQGAIQTLTRLFEQARYSSLPANPREEALAFSCLTTIADACKAIGDQHENR